MNVFSLGIMHQLLNTNNQALGIIHLLDPSVNGWMILATNWSTFACLVESESSGG